LFFARHLDNFIMTEQFAFIYRDSKKQVTATLTPTNQTAGPLAQIALRINKLATRHNLLKFTLKWSICSSIWTMPALA
jgi:hypothetical protein